MGYGIKVDISGSRACFTRPEMKAERISYDVMTPSAARGILESVYWKPAIRWIIDGICVMNPIRFDTFRRNEVGIKGSYSLARTVERTGEGILYIDATKERQQRAMTYLKDVRYVVSAHFELTDEAGSGDTPEKHYNIMLRRLRNGQCFNQPYLGCREFAVGSIGLVEDDADLPRSAFAVVPEMDFGYMLYDIDFAHDMEPMFFRAIMRGGWIDVAKAREEVVR